MTRHVVLIYGNTCSGKSTLGIAIQTQLGIDHVSFGDLKRRAINLGTPEGLAVQECTQAGQPVRAIDAWSIVKSGITSSNFVLTGFPINKEELYLLLGYCQISGVVSLSLSETVIRSRYQNRAICPTCLSPGKLGDYCHKHGISLVSREDTNNDELERRLKLNQRIVSFLHECHMLTDYSSLVLDGTEPSKILTNRLIQWLSTKTKEWQQ